MTTALALNHPLDAPSRPSRKAVSARLAIYGEPLMPPAVEAFDDSDPARLVDALYVRTAARAQVPALAVRELIENLVHADFNGALVSVLEGGLVVRVSDQGPGIPDKALALEPGFSTAGPREREVVRGVGCGLPLAAGLIEAEGGRLELADNLGGGTVATLAAPGERRRPGPSTLSDTARALLALLLELGPASCQALATELGVSCGECGRELALLEHRDLVSRDEQGLRALTERGTALVETLF